MLYTLTHPWSDGTRQLLFQPLELLEKLAVLVRRPRINLLLYHGVLAAHARGRAETVRTACPPPDAAVADALSPPERTAQPSDDAAPAAPGRFDIANAGDRDSEPAAPPRRHWAWADLLRRVFAIDVLTCACGGRLRLIATIEDPLVVQRILRHLGLPTEPPGLYPARPPPGEGDTLVFDFPLERRLRPEAADPDDGAGTTLPAAVCLDARCRAPQSPAHGSRRASPARAAASSELWREIEG